MRDTPAVADVLQFHEGRTGIGCLVLRLYAALLALGAALPCACNTGWQTAILLLLAAALIVGFRTRACAVVLMIMMVSAPFQLPWLHLVSELTGVATVVLLGAGAYSIDARLYGRRRVSIPGRQSSSPPKG